jgi:C1A family cysteine protease
LSDAVPYKITEYHRVLSIDLLKAALAEGLPVVIGIDVYESFESESATATGVIPMPNTSKEQLLGGHAICCAGYDDSSNWVIFRNSWGTSWGDKGYGYLPYAYFDSLVSDMWTSKG